MAKLNKDLVPVVQGRNLVLDEVKKLAIQAFFIILNEFCHCVIPETELQNLLPGGLAVLAHACSRLNELNVQESENIANGRTGLVNVNIFNISFGVTFMVNYLRRNIGVRGIIPVNALFRIVAGELFNIFMNI